jgi:hypothetical protein
MPSCSDLDLILNYWSTDLKLLTDYYLRIYPDLPPDWEVFAARIIEDRRRRLRILEVEGGRLKMIGYIDEAGEEQSERSYSCTETFLLEHANYQAIAAKADIMLYEPLPRQLELDVPFQDHPET